MCQSSELGGVKNQVNRTRRGRIQMLLLLSCFALPVIASYFAYYVVRPVGGMTNYGFLIAPQRPIPPTLRVEEGRFPQDLAGDALPLAGRFEKKWLLISVHPALACTQACVKKLFFMRQLRVGQGSERFRLVPLWLMTDKASVASSLLMAYGDTQAAVQFLRADAQALEAWLPVESGHTMEDYLYLVDPQGNLMMRFPASPDATRMRKDLSKLLKWNAIGKGQGA